MLAKFPDKDLVKISAMAALATPAIQLTWQIFEQIRGLKCDGQVAEHTYSGRGSGYGQ